MWNTSHEPNYKKYQSGLLSNALAGNVAGDLLTFPDFQINGKVLKPEKIMVQAHPDNVGAVVVGKTSPLADTGADGGFFLAPGAMQVLPDNDPSAWRVRGTGAGGQGLIYTYLSEPS